MKPRKKRPLETGTPVLVRMQASQLRWLDGDRAMRAPDLSRPEAVRMILEERRASMSSYDSFIREFYRHKINIDGSLSDPKFESPPQFEGPVEAITWIKEHGLADHTIRFEVQLSQDGTDLMTVTPEVLKDIIEQAPT